MQVFQPGLYWLVYEQDTATGQMVILNSVATVTNLTGNDFNNTTPQYYYTVAHTFGALPDPFTAGATFGNTQSSVTTPIPAIGIRPI